MVNNCLLTPAVSDYHVEEKEKTYVILEWDVKENIHVHFYTTDGDRLKEMNYTASL